MSSSNTFNSMNANYKQTYSDQKKKDRFKKLRTLMQSKGKATAQLEASKDPMKFLKENKEPSIKNLKGVAF